MTIDLYITPACLFVPERYLILYIPSHASHALVSSDILKFLFNYSPMQTTLNIPDAPVMTPGMFAAGGLPQQVTAYPLCKHTQTHTHTLS